MGKKGWSLLKFRMKGNLNETCKSLRGLDEVGGEWTFGLVRELRTGVAIRTLPQTISFMKHS